MVSNPRTIAYLRRLGMDTVIVKTPPSASDYADIKSGNKVTVTYYATGKSTKGKEYQNEKLDISNILDSQSGKLKDTIMFDNGEGRIIIDLKKSIPISKINFYINQFRDRGSQIFSIWSSSTNPDITGDPKTRSWKYVGVYGVGSGRGMTSSGSSFIFDNNLTCRYLMLITDGAWHGTELIRQLDIFEKK
jgi:hypothetical protein